jgi:hypothetical protein
MDAVTRTDAGSRAFFIMRSYIATARTQDRNPSMLACPRDYPGRWDPQTGGASGLLVAHETPVIAGSRSAFPCLHRAGREAEPTPRDRDG